MNDGLLETLRAAQRFGFFGAARVEDAVHHSMAYVEALSGLTPLNRLVDLGSGGGLPGLVLATEFPTVEVVLLDRRQKRTDFLERAVARLGLSGAQVMFADVTDLIRAVQRGDVPRFDGVTARGFGPPELTLRSAVALVRTGGYIVVSEPPDRHRWPTELLDELELRSWRHGPVRVFTSASN